jgi:hypothetical protein
MMKVKPGVAGGRVVGDRTAACAAKKFLCRTILISAVSVPILIDVSVELTLSLRGNL